MIVKNEEQYLANSLKSVQALVDEMIIIDTGSTDKTAEIAQSLNAKVYNFPWNGNFSDARNFSLNKASGDWILILDGDEELVQEDQQKIKDLIQTKSADAYYLKVYSYFGNKSETEKLLDARVSLFKNNKKFRYRGAIHEEIISSINEFGKSGIKFSDISIIHYGYLDEVVELKNKTKRNKDIIIQEINKDKKNTFLQYALATEYLQDENYQQAQQLLTDVVNKWSFSHPNYSDAVYKLSLSLKELKEYEKCNILLIKSIELFPDYTDLYYSKGSLEMELGKWDLAEDSFIKCIDLGPPANSYYSFDGVGTFRAWYALGLIYEVNKQTDKAINAYLMTLKNSSNFNDGLLRMVQYTLKVMKKDQFIKLIQKHFDLRHPETFYSIGQSLLRFNRFDYLLELSKNNNYFVGNERNYLYFSKLCESMAKKILAGENDGK